MSLSVFLNPLLPVKLIKIIRFLFCALLFSSELPKKSRYPLRVVGWFVFCVAVSAALPILSDSLLYVTTVFLIECILCALTVRVCCKADWMVTLYVASAVYCTEHLASMLDSTVSLLAPEQLSYIKLQHLNGWILLNFAFFGVTVAAAVYFLMFRKRNLTESNNLSVNAMLLMLAISLFINLYVNLVYSQMFPDRSAGESLFAYGFNILCSIFLLKIQSGLLRESQMETKLQMTSILWEQAREQYRISKDTIDVINMKSHDLKHRLMAVKDKASEDEFADIMEAIDSYDSQIVTGNEVLDVVFQEKNMICRKRGIQFACIIDGFVLSFMDTTDLYVLFGNLIDNCIEAVSHLPEDEVKNIQVTIHREKGFIIIQTENGYTGSLKWNDGRLRTSKEDKQNHGYGMLSIENIVHKYGGRYSISTEDNVFCMNIVLPVPKETK